MNRIGGLLQLDGHPVDAAHLAGMSAALAGHGPDGEGLWCSGATGLFQRQPADRGFCPPPIGLYVVADARLDNQCDLARRLGLPPEAADGDVIAAAYQEWGTECATHLLGDFAFAVWDAEQRRLFCARDAFGVRPLYCHHAPGRLFVFASEIKALLAVAAVPRRLNERRVADFLASMMEDRRRTFYEGIERLPAAHCLTVDTSGVRSWQYWSLGSVPNLDADDAECEERFRRAFLVAVERRLPRGQPVGTLLSGGLDSSSITCVARHALQGAATSLHTFSALFPTLPKCDEQPYVNAVTAAGGLTPHSVVLDEASPLEEIEAVLAAQDEPFYGPNLFIHRALYRAAAQQGIRVLLDGLDGDTTVSHGLAYATELFLGGRWGSLLREMRAARVRRGAGYLQVLATRCLRPAVPPSLLEWRVARNAVSDWRMDLLHPEFVSRTGLMERVREAASEAAHSPRTAREAHVNGLSRGVHQVVHEMLDHAAAPYGLEPRYPFYDRELAELCVSLPGNQKLRDGWTRWVMRASLGGIVPDEVRWRPRKSDLSGSFNRGLLLLEGERLGRLFREEEERLGTYVNMPGMRIVFQRFLAGADKMEPLIVWKLATLCLWLRQSLICS